MNEKSNGSLRAADLSIPVGLAAALFGGFAATLSGCPGPTPQSGTGAGGGGGGTTSTSSTTSSDTGSTTSSDTGSTTSDTGSTTSSAECGVDTDCPDFGNLCEKPFCKMGTCIFKPVSAGTPCVDGGKVCDGASNCVECLTPDHCKDPADVVCSDQSVFTAPPTCSANTCLPSTPEDCKLQTKVCSETQGCVQCLGDDDCSNGTTTGGCEIPKCDLTLNECFPSHLPQATPCLQAGNAGTCDAAGVCKPGKYVFLTSELFPPSFPNGVAGADAACNDAAHAVPLGGVWVSWTSDSNQPPSTPLARIGTNAPGPYKLLDDTTFVVTGLSALLAVLPLPSDAVLLNPINWTETGTTVSGEIVWTGTKPGNVASGSTCTNWTVLGQGTVGNSGSIDSFWTKFNTITCAATTLAHLYCFQK